MREDNNYFEFVSPGKILCGTYALENIKYELELRGLKKPLLLSDRTLEKTGLVDTVKKAVECIDTWFFDIPRDSSIEVCTQIKALYLENKCDAIIALGGGSVLDTGKGSALLLGQNTDSLLNVSGCEVLKQGSPIPLILIPTTSGTGSEATAVAVIKHQNVKLEFISSFVLPTLSVIDPRCTISLPPLVTASTGVDALVHAIEAFICLQHNPISDAFALSAIKLIKANLMRVMEKPNDEKGRLNLATASLLAGFAFSNAMVGGVHALGHALGGISSVPHGVAMGILLPHVLEYNRAKCKDSYEELALTLCGVDKFVACNATERSELLIIEVRELLSYLHQKCGLPIRLSETSCKKEDLERVAELSLNDGAMIVNPRAMSKDDALGLLMSAW